MPIEDPEGEFGAFKTQLFYDVIKKNGLTHEILLQTDAYQEFPVAQYGSRFSSSAFWHYVCRKTVFKSEHIDMDFWDAFPAVKKAIEEDSTEKIYKIRIYKYRYPLKVS